MRTSAPYTNSLNFPRVVLFTLLKPYWHYRLYLSIPNTPRYHTSGFCHKYTPQTNYVSIINRNEYKIASPSYSLPTWVSHKKSWSLQKQINSSILKVETV